MGRQGVIAMKKLFTYILSLIFLFPTLAFGLGISYEDETGYTYGQGYGSFVDGASWFSGEVIGSNLVLNGSFETGGTGNNFNGGSEIDDNVTDSFSYYSNGYLVAPNRAEATATSQTGSVALKLVNTTGDAYTNLRCYTNPNIVSTPLTLYKLTFYTRGDGTNSGFYSAFYASTPLIGWTSTGITGTTYQKITKYFITPAGGTSIRLYFAGSATNGSIIYFDNVVLTPVTSLATQPSLNRNILVVKDAEGDRAIGYIGGPGTGLTTAALPNNVTGITKANPGVVSSVAHALAIGNQTYFTGLTEMTELNGLYPVVTAVGSADLFSILDTSGYSAAETTGGAVGFKVTEPDLSAVHIYKEYGLVNEGWAEIDANFNMNAITEVDVHRQPGRKLGW